MSHLWQQPGWEELASDQEIDAYLRDVVQLDPRQVGEFGQALAVSLMESLWGRPGDAISCLPSNEHADQQEVPYYGAEDEDRGELSERRGKWWMHITV